MTLWAYIFSHTQVTQRFPEISTLEKLLGKKSGNSKKSDIESNLLTDGIIVPFGPREIFDKIDESRLKFLCHLLYELSVHGPQKISSIAEQIDSNDQKNTIDRLGRGFEKGGVYEDLGLFEITSGFRKSEGRTIALSILGILFAMNIFGYHQRSPLEIRERLTREYEGKFEGMNLPINDVHSSPVLDSLAKNYVDALPIIFKNWEFFKKHQNFDVHVLFDIASPKVILTKNFSKYSIGGDIDEHGTIEDGMYLHEIIQFIFLDRNFKENFKEEDYNLSEIDPVIIEYYLFWCDFYIVSAYHSKCIFSYKQDLISGKSKVTLIELLNYTYSRPSNYLTLCLVKRYNDFIKKFELDIKEIKKLCIILHIEKFRKHAVPDYKYYKSGMPLHLHILSMSKNEIYDMLKKYSNAERPDSQDMSAIEEIESIKDVNILIDRIASNNLARMRKKIQSLDPTGSYTFEEFLKNVLPWK